MNENLTDRSNQPDYTAEDVHAKMQELGISGFSSMGDFTPNERMIHLLDIEKKFKERENYQPISVAVTMGLESQNSDG